jgi:hypothetical protein
MSKSKALTLSEFKAREEEIRTALRSALETELLDCAIPELGGDASTDLWDLPVVDSKTVVKLSPVLDDLIGHRINPSWIKKGGYSSVDEAVNDLMDKIRTHCVEAPAAAAA